MAFFKVNKSEEAVKETTGGNYINKSGIYDLHVIGAFVSQGNGESITVDFYVDYNGTKQPLYGNLRLTNKDGSPNFGADIFNKLLVILDLDTVADPIEAELPIGKDGAMKTVALLEDLTDFDIKMRIQMEYSVYQGDIKEKKIIKNFYRASDGATAEEIVKGVEPGKQLEKDMKYADKVIYKDGLDEETVNKWIEAGRPKGFVTDNISKPSTPAFAKKSPFSKS